MAIIKNPLTLVKQEGGQTQGEYFARVIDYDGTVLKMEWLNNGDSFELPTPPTHEGLVFDGWSSTQEIVNNSITIDENNFMAGALYYTESGYNELEIELDVATGLEVSLYGTSGTITVWGDGTQDTWSANETKTHTYSDYGKYIIKTSYSTINNNFRLTPDFCLKKLYLKQNDYCHSNFSNFCYNLEVIAWGRCNSFGFTAPYNIKRSLIKAFIYQPSSATSYTDTSSSYFFQCKDVVVPYNVTNLDNSLGGPQYIVLPNTLTKINEIFLNYGAINFKIPKNVIEIKSCRGYNIAKIKLPNHPITFTGSSFASCYSLEEINIPEGSVLSNITYSGIFNSCYKLKTVKLPESFTIIANSMFYYCYSLEKIEIPSGVTEIGTYAFNNCYCCRLFDFSKCQQIPTLTNVNSFGSSAGKILVPAALYNDWIVATNWSSLASRIVAVS